VSRLGESSAGARYFVAGLVAGAGVVFAASDFAASDFAGAPRSEVGTFGGAGFSDSHPIARAPTQTIKANANDFRIAVDPLRFESGSIRANDRFVRNSARQRKSQRANTQ
jgi:hypothetical protein